MAQRSSKPGGKRVTEATKSYFSLDREVPMSHEYMSAAVLDSGNVLQLLEAASVAGASVYFGFNRSGGLKLAVYCGSERPEFWVHTPAMLQPAVGTLWDGLDAYARAELETRYNRLRQSRFDDDVTEYKIPE